MLWGSTAAAALPTTHAAHLLILLIALRLRCCERLLLLLCCGLQAQPAAASAKAALRSRHTAGPLLSVPYCLVATSGMQPG